MALIKCLICNTAISDTARFCPKCGCPLHDTVGRTTVPAKKRTSPATWGCLIVVGLFALAMVASSSRNSDNGRRTQNHRETLEPAALSQARKSTDELIEFKLACLNAGHRVSENHITVARFRHLLNNMSKKISLAPQWKDKRAEIADVSVSCIQILEKDYGKKVSLLDFMEGMNEILPEGFESNYLEIATAYTVLSGNN